jgi:hypothetical protein
MISPIRSKERIGLKQTALGLSLASMVKPPSSIRRVNQHE